MKVLFSLIGLILFASTAQANPIELAGNITSKLTELRVPVDFVVTNSGGAIGAQEDAYKVSFKTSAHSIYKDMTFGVRSPNVVVSEFTDTSIKISISYEQVQAYTAAGVAQFSLRNNFSGNVHCFQSSEYKWVCSYAQLTQDFGPKLNPNPIQSIDSNVVVTTMGPEKVTIQTQILKVTTALAEQY